MKLLVKKLWFPHSVDDIVEALFRIPQMRERFDKGYRYDGEMRPRGIKICSGYWSADKIMAKILSPERDVCLILTGLELQGDAPRISGKGRDRIAIASSTAYTGGNGFCTQDINFNAMTFGEIGHSLGLQHHVFDSSNPCEMSHNCYPGPTWSSLSEIRFCNKCYKK